jgi:Zn-dependent membrane protease YugP
MTMEYWLFALPGILLGLYAQMKLSSTYRRYIRQPVASGRSGAEAARQILDHAGLTDMPVNEIGGHLTDHYDPRKKALFLSSENYRGRSLAAVGVAAHEAGHALQHKDAYAPLQLRMMLVPVTQFASWAWMGLVILGIALGFAKLILAGVVIFAIIALFQIVTLPVEFNASSRAKVQLLNLGIVHPQESRGMGQVLSAAAMTYVAAMIQSLGQLLYFLSLARNRD